MNKFAAYTPAEYKALLGRRTTRRIESSRILKNDKVYPTNLDSFDWRDKNVVNPIKDQGQCGSCWAFSAVQAQESKWAIVHKELLTLSEQNLVDCVTKCDGCNGGNEADAYDYVIKTQKGLWNLEKDYPYKAIDGTCQFNEEKGVAKIVSYYRPTTTESEDTVGGALAADGVVSVAIDASNWSFQLYSSGIYDEPSCDPHQLDHAVGLVGFGVENNVKYWIVRNSWGTSWGEKGYIRMIRGMNNQCGIATDAIIPMI